MALETLKDLKEIGGFELMSMASMKEQYPEQFDERGAMNYEFFEKEIRPKMFIYHREDKNSITFTIQNGPIKEVGVNGCQVDTLIETARIMIRGLNKKFPCVENNEAILYLSLALEWLKKRKADRELRGVEGKNIL